MPLSGTGSRSHSRINCVSMRILTALDSVKCIGIPGATISLDDVWRSVCIYLMVLSKVRSRKKCWNRWEMASEENEEAFIYAVFAFQGL